MTFTTETIQLFIAKSIKNPLRELTEKTEKEVSELYEEFRRVSQSNLMLNHTIQLDEFLHSLWNSSDGFIQVIKSSHLIFESTQFLINWVAYTNQKNDLDYGKTILEKSLTEYEMAQEKEINSVKNDLEDIFSDFFETLSNNEVKDETKNLENLIKKFERLCHEKDKLRVYDYRIFLNKVRQELKNMHKNFVDDLLNILTANVDSATVDTLPSRENLEELYAKVWNYYSQMSNYIGESDEAKRTIRHVWSSVFGESLLTYVKMLQTQKKENPKHKNFIILGETGTGKEMIAKAVGGIDTTIINIAAFEENMIEARLFGVAPNFATDVSSSLGLFLEASGKYKLSKEKSDEGSVVEIEKKNGESSTERAFFLDEIGDIPEEIQVKLLRAIETQKIRRVGGLTSHKISVRIISATNKSIYRMIQNGQFRRDLFERIASGGVIKTHPLRKRGSDFLKISEHYYNQNWMPLFSHDKWLYLVEWLETYKNHKWYGNVRELQRAIDSFCYGNADMFDEIVKDQAAAENNDISDTPEIKEILEKIFPLEKVKELYIRYAFEKKGRNMSAAAKALHISRQMVSGKINKGGGSTQ